MRSRRSSRSLRVALVLSALIHLCVLGWMWTRPQPAPPAVAVRPIEIEINTLPPPAPEALPAKPVEPPPRRAPVKPLRVAVRETTPPPQGTPEAPNKGGGGLASDVPTREDVPHPNVMTLMPSSHFTLGPSTVVRGPGDEHPSAQTQAARIVGDIVAQNRRTHQAPHDFFRELRVALEGLWQVDVLIQARRVMAQDGDKARVRLVQNADGTVAEVAFVTPPMSAELARGLLADLQNGNAALPAPPAALMRGRPQMATLWDFMVKPPPPVVKLSFEFDVTALLDKRALPKYTRKRVEFLAQEE